MRKKNIFSALLSLFLLVPASITWAQTISSQKGLTTAVFTTSGGNIKVYLPHDIRSNDLISGCVIAEPIGKNAKQTANNLAELKKYSITINNEKFAVDNTTNPFRFLVNADQTKTGLIELINGSGIKAGKLTIPSVPEKSLQPAPSQCKIPSHGLTGLPFRITGPFDGNSSNTNCMLDNKPMEILVKSPRECIVLYPPGATGIKTLNVQESGKQLCSQQVSGVQMNISAGKLDLLKGEETYINVSITGLQNLPDTALLTLANITTSVVVMQPSNMIVIALSPDSVGSGTFNKTFNIQSIRTGTFSVNVNLDLPENQPDNPPTQPQPGDHPPTQPQPQPRDSTTTVPQCPKCNCYCSATIIPVEEKDGVSTYRVSVTASCSGQFGPPPCKACGIIDAYEYEWQVSFSAGDGIEHIGRNNGSRFSFRNPKNAPFSLYINVQVKCSDGSKCSCTATMSYEPTVPEEKECQGCQCECSALIYAIDEDGEEREYGVYVNAVVTGDYDIPPCKKCEIIDTTYVWSIDSEDFAKIFGSNIGKKVKLRTIKPGKYVLTVAVTITCSDGHECKCGGTKEGNVPEKLCSLTSKEMMEPIMFGGLDPSSHPAKPIKIKRDDFIALKAKCADIDYLRLMCTKSDDCLDDGSSVVFEPLSGNVKFEWEIEGKGEMGKFVKIGCLPEDVSAKGEQVIFKPPYIPLPKGKDAKGKDIIEKTETVIKLSIIDDVPVVQLKDPTVERTITILTWRTSEEPDFYQMTVTEDDKKQPEDKEKYTSKRLQCRIPDKLKWVDVKSTNEKLAIIIPKINDSDSLIAGEWLVLETNDQNDTDNLKVKCDSKQCDNIGVFDKDYADRLEWVWKVDEGKGTFAGSKNSIDKGRVVIYQAPLVTKETEIIITVTVNDDGLKFDDPLQSATIKIWVYPGGIKLNYPSTDWVPDPDKPATFKSYLVYKDKEEIWRPAFKHFSRIHFFELMEVSNEKGVCLNAPVSKDAKACRDLLLKPEEDNLEAIVLNELMKAEAIKNKCDLTYYLEARTAKPANEYEIKVHAEDYGSFGFLRSFANLNMHNEVEQKKQSPNYESVKVKKVDVKHPYEDPVTKKHRDKKSEYPDNRVNIPMDIDENHIPDNGWIYSIVEVKGVGKTIFSMPDFTDDIKIDFDNEPIGDGIFGDGLSVYEEYRGFKTIGEGGAIKHIRTNPNVKDLFINNEDDLLMDIFDTITGLDLHKINAELYNGNEERTINFNFGSGHQDFVQKGLWLIDGTGENLINLCEPVVKDDSDPVVLLGICCPVKIVNKAKSRQEIEKPGPPNLVKKVVVYKGRIVQNALNRGYNVIEKEKQVVAHELCHALNVYHHGERNMTPGLASGDRTCVMRYDHIGGVRNDVIGVNLCNAIGGANDEYGRGNCKLQIRVSGNPAIKTIDRMKKK